VHRTTRLTVSAFAALAVLATPAAADAKMAKGLQDDSMILSPDPVVRTAFWRDAKAAKVKSVRVLVRWNGRSRRVDPETISRIRGASIEGEMAGAKLLVGTYATLGRRKPAGYRMRSSTQDAYVAFMGDLAAKLADRPLAGYLTYNEPNYKTAWPLGHERTWVALSNRVYKEIKRQDDDAKVLVGESSPNARNQSVAPGTFFRRALCLNLSYRSASGSKSCRTKLLADGFTLHTYDFERPPTRPIRNKDQWVHGNLGTTVQQIKRLARAGRISPKAARNIQITEFAYRTAGKMQTNDRRAAAWLKLAWNSAKRHGITSFTWYQLRDPKGRSDWKSGLQTSKGHSRKTWKTFKALR
jgi:hypothetical protein